MTSPKTLAREAWERLPRPAKAAVKSVWASYARLTSSDRLLPDYLIIGTQRGGTTSLYKYLVQHPETAHALTKEIRFFDQNFERGLGWYRSRFPSAGHRDHVRRARGTRLVVGEASPDYMFHPHAPGRIARTLPRAKLIVLLRNPVDRAWSHYWHQRTRGHESLPFEEAIAREPKRLAGELEKLLADPSAASYERHHHSYVERGLYAEQLQTWFGLFPRDRFLIERSEDFFEDPALVFKRVLDFLNLPGFDPPRYETFNAFAEGTMAPAIRRQLIETFRPHNERLYDLLGRDFGWES